MKILVRRIAVVGILGLCGQANCGNASDNVIEPGTSLGAIHIGHTKNAVAALSGMARYLSSREVVVRYGNDGRVTEILTISPHFRTTQGITTRTSAKAFRKAFPSARLTCTVDRGASGTSTSMIYDDIASGIAFSTDALTSRKTESINSITVDRRGLPVSIFGEIVNCSALRVDAR